MIRILLLFVCLVWPWNALTHAEEELPVELKAESNGIASYVDGKIFFTYRVSKSDRPSVYPVYGPGQVRMTRDYPFKSDTPGEADDHPHHQSIWFGHGDMNGVSFWHNEGSVRVIDVQTIQHSETEAIKSQSIFFKGDKEVATLATDIQFGGTKTTRWIDFDYKIKPAADELTFGDTKEGTFAIRSHPQLRLDNDPNRGVTKANGKAVNSEGVKGKAVWGKSAKWICYHGKIEGESVGFIMMDHPDNLRHPTTWHARGYGLVAANPFGLHHFQKKPKGSGKHVLKQGETLRLRYRILFFAGAFEAEMGEKAFKAYRAKK